MKARPSIVQTALACRTNQLDEPGRSAENQSMNPHQQHYGRSSLRADWGVRWAPRAV
jgi:hypothetical protein